MVLETPLIPFLEWLQEAVPTFVQVALGLTLAALLFSGLWTVLQYGPTEAAGRLWRGLVEGLGDLPRTSPRRVAALSWLAFKESIRRKVLVVFALFLIILLFAGWYLDRSGDRPAQVFLAFVMTATLYLTLVLALVLSAFSLPTDIRDRTIFTVVSKPVRRQEIVLGRILGFTLTGTLILVGMGLVSFVFVLRGLDHTHRLVERDLKVVEPSPRDPAVKIGRTAMAHGHFHEVRVYPDGTAETDNAQGHWHEVKIEKDGDRTRYLVGPPQGVLNARQVVFGELSFLDRSGQPGKGVNVGNEWEYRSFIEGGTNAAAVWRFQGLDESMFTDRDALPVELTLRVFRTHIGIPNQGVLGSMVLRNPATGRSSERELFMAKEYYTDVKLIRRKLRDSDLNEIDLFKDLIHNGELEIVVACEHPGQYFGMARYDMYFRANDRPFWLNFVKGYVSIWLRMVLVIGLGVMFSTFLRGAVAMFTTVAVVLGGFFTDYMLSIADSERGPLDAMFRIVTHTGDVGEISEGTAAELTQMIDQGFNGFLKVLVAVVPDFGAFNNADFVAQGFDVPMFMAPGVASQVLSTLAYLIPMFLVAHFALRGREVAQ